MTSRLVLLLDDSELIVSMLEMICAQLGHRTVSATAYAQVPELIVAHDPDIVITDLNLPDVPQGDTVRSLRTLTHEAPIIIVSGMPQAELERIALERGAQGAISKDAGLPGMMSALGPMLAALLPG